MKIFISSNLLGLFFLLAFSFAQMPGQIGQPSATPGQQGKQEGYDPKSPLGGTVTPRPASTLKAINYEKITIRYHYSREGETSDAQHLLDIVKMLKTKITTFKGLDFSKDFTTKFITKKKFDEYFDNDIFLYNKFEQIQFKEKKYKFLGMIPSTTNLKESIKKLFFEDKGCHFNFMTKQLIMFEWIPAETQPVYLTRELALVLQDQYYDLTSLFVKFGFNLDKRHALDFISQGEAIQTELEINVANQGGDAKNRFLGEEIREEIIERIQLLVLKYNIPIVLAEEYFLPIFYGLNFIDYGRKYFTFKKLLKLFEKPPLSTEQVMHPEKYYRPEMIDKPTRLRVSELDKLFVKSDWVFKQREIIGEFGFYLWLRGKLEKEKSLMFADGWSGDITQYYENSKTSNYAVISFSTWDSIKEASDAFNGFYAYFGDFLGKSRMKIVKNEPNEYHISFSGFDLFLKSLNKNLLIIFGFDTELTKSIVKKFSQ